MENIALAPGPALAPAPAAYFHCKKCGIEIANSASFICYLPLTLPSTEVGGLFSEYVVGNLVAHDDVDGPIIAVHCLGCREILGYQYLLDDDTMPFIKQNMIYLTMEKLNYYGDGEIYPEVLFVDCFLCRKCTKFIARTWNVEPLQTARHYTDGRVILAQVSNVMYADQPVTTFHDALEIEGFSTVFCNNCASILGWKHGDLGSVNLNLTKLWLRHFNRLIPAETLSL